MSGISDIPDHPADHGVIIDRKAESALPRSLRILAVVEGTTVVSGVSKNLLQFCRVARTFENGPQIDLAVATFERPHQQVPDSLDSIEPFVEAARQSGVQVHRLPERFRFDTGILGHLRQLTDRLKPHIIQTHAPKSHFLLRFTGLCKKVPWIGFHHGYTDTVWHSPIQNQLDRYSLPAAARVVTVSDEFKRRLITRGVPEEQITVLHNAVQTKNGEVPIDPGTRCRNKQTIGSSPEEKIVLAVGRLSREKAQIDLVFALHHLRRLRPEMAVRLVLVGEGPDKAKILNAAESLHIAESVTFAGHQHDVAPYYQAADAVAIPSHSEGSPNVLLEAMAWGIPVAATTVGGIPEIVKHSETALLVSPRRAELMASAIDLLLSNTNLAASLARQARALVESSFSPESRATRLLQIYTDVYQTATQKMCVQ